MKSTRVLITGASPDHLNRNHAMRGYVTEGFAAILSAECVQEVSLEFAPSAIKSFNPDLVLCFGSVMPDGCGYSELHAAAIAVKSQLAFWLHDDPYEFDCHTKILRYADLIISNDRWAAMHYDTPGVRHLPMAASPTVHRRDISLAKKNLDVFFCGVGFENRLRLVSDLSDVLAKKKVTILGDGWEADKYPFCQNRRINNNEVSDYYASSLVTLNMGRHFNLANRRYELDASTPGPRTFEAAMAGATQAFFVEGLEIEDYFEPDREILLFDSVSDFERILKRISDDPGYSMAIGTAAQDRALKDHTYKQRANQILKWTDLHS